MSLYMACFLFCSLFYITACLSQKKSISEVYSYRISYQDGKNNFRKQIYSQNNPIVPTPYNLYNQQTYPNKLLSIQQPNINSIITNNEVTSRWGSQPLPISWSRNTYNASPKTMSDIQNVLHSSSNHLLKPAEIFNSNHHLIKRFPTVNNNIYHHRRRRHIEDKNNDENRTKQIKKKKSNLLVKEEKSFSYKDLPKSYEVYESISDDIIDPSFNIIYGYIPIDKTAITKGHGYTIFGRKYAFYVPFKPEFEDASEASEKTLSSSEEHDEYNDIQKI